jgi:hypothetical protein
MIYINETENGERKEVPINNYLTITLKNVRKYNKLISLPISQNAFKY